MHFKTLFFLKSKPSSILKGLETRSCWSNSVIEQTLKDDNDTKQNTQMVHRVF